ncbi:MAG: ABC transporter permease [Rhodobacteraceae bacterium]|nr:ABC transporter permease [Paracoccaceae bacterium]
MKLLHFPVPVGMACLAIFSRVGHASMFLAATLAALAKPPHYFREFARALVSIGYNSIPIVGLTTLFTGGALALQVFSGGSRLNAEAAVPSIVAIGMVRELGPVLCGLMIAGRVGSAIAAEVATMRVTDQIDALKTLSTNPLNYLVAPRVAAATLVLPMLTAVGDVVGILGGYLVGTTRLGFSSSEYLGTTVRYLESGDIVSGLAKGAMFGFIVAVCGCYCGLNAGKGARGVGAATTRSVATASILIIAANFVMTELFF